MAEKYVKRIRTPDGDLPIDYKALANLPVVDTELDETSANAISNSAVATKFDEEKAELNAALLEIIAIQEDHMTPDGNGVKY